MSHFLSIQHTCTGIELALFRQDSLISLATEDKKLASKNCVVLVKHILQANALSFHDLSFFAANQGPGPFTTLRVVIATINGLACASQKPLIGIDGLAALLFEYADKQYPVNVALLNAYGNDVYFGIQTNDGHIRTGYKNAYILLTDLALQFPEQKIYFIGQATTLYAPLIHNHLAENGVIPHIVPEQASLHCIGSLAWKMWQKKMEGVDQLLPLYLKNFVITPREPSNF
jgi:tRNA threonylcarbamoyladenosine biosynthesis protein TsaB